MSFRFINIKKSYINKGDNNLLDSLLKPALKQAVIYRRSVGFFSSDVLTLISDVLPDFVNNSGKIELIVSPSLSTDDIETIKNAYQDKTEFLRNNFIDNFNNELSKINDENLQLLYDLVYSNVLNIKVACVKAKIGIYHDKLGILTDEKGNDIVFYGSANSSVGGYELNYEKIRVVSNLTGGDPEIINDEKNEFQKLWENKNQFVDVYDFMDSVKKSVLVARDARVTAKKASSHAFELRYYQKEAIANWVNNGYNGFYVMATGTGKTWTAIYSLKELWEKQKVVSVIACPYKHLVKQWIDDLSKAFPKATIIPIYSENPTWYIDSKKFTIPLKRDDDVQVILVSTLKSFYTDKFLSILKEVKKEKILIVDEAHRFNNLDKSIADIFKYKLGLSATPFTGKSFDTGSDIINYFGGLVYSFPIKRALDEKYLVHYNYHPIFVHSTPEEEKRFMQLSFQISSCFQDNQLANIEKLLQCSKARVRLVALAKEKQTKIKDILLQVDAKDHFIVYCGDGHLFDEDLNETKRHIDFVKKNLVELGKVPSQFTASENMLTRTQLIDSFNEGEIDCLVAIRCLDEGIDIPSIKTALIIASNDNYRETVQRRGRILRLYRDKKISNIYDVIVLPNDETCNGLAKMELTRYCEYAKLANNRDELMLQLNTLLKEYGLSFDDVNKYDNLVDSEGDIDE